MYKKTKEFRSENEAKRANKHANKRVIYWPPFWNKVYKHHFKANNNNNDNNFASSNIYWFQVFEAQT